MSSLVVQSHLLLSCIRFGKRLFVAPLLTAVGACAAGLMWPQVQEATRKLYLVAVRGVVRGLAAALKQKAAAWGATPQQGEVNRRQVKVSAVGAQFGP